MASFLDGLGKTLLGGLGGMGGMGSGGGMFGSLFGGGGGGGGMGGSSGGSSSGGGFGGLGGILRTLAPIAGTALGTYFGGPAGGMIGGNLAGALGNSIFGGDESQQQPQQQQGYGPQQSYGNQFGTSMGNTLNQGFNQYLPQQMQGQTFGNMGGAIGGYLGNKFGMPELGSRLGNMANPYIQQYMPQDMRNVQMGNFGGYLGSQAGQRMDQGFQSRGMNPYSTPNYGSSMSNQLPDYSQSGYESEPIPIPNAPPFDLYDQSPSGYSPSSSYGEIPPAPPLGNINMGGARGGYSGAINNPSSYPMQEPTSGRNALLSDIRNFRRSPSAQSQPMSQPQNYEGIPPAPPLGDVFGNSPRSPSGFGMRSGVSRPTNMFSEFRDRAAQPRMGLRPTQTRASSAYPSSDSSGMMDLLRNRLGDIRNSVAPNEYPRNFMLRGA